MPSRGPYNSLGAYTCPRVREILSLIRDPNFEAERFHAEIEALTVQELRQLGREILKGNNTLTEHLQAVRAELAARCVI